MTFTKTLYTDETFSFDDLVDINFDRYITDNGNQYGYYDIDLYLLPVIKGKQYIFSYYSYAKSQGTQTREFDIRYSFGETCLFGIIPSVGYDKYGI
jgi:hypothetical protein